MKPNAIQVAIDILRELGREEEARWLEHPDAVRALLRDAPADRNGECPNGCHGDPYTPHDRDCPIVAAWHALGDPRAAQDVDNAHEEALRYDKRTCAAVGGHCGGQLVAGWEYCERHLQRPKDPHANLRRDQDKPTVPGFPRVRAPD